VEEVVIVLADLYLSSAAEAASIRGVELPGLARIARYGTGQPLATGWRPWLATWSGQALLAPEPPATVAAAASQAKAHEINGKMVWLATPVHLVAGLSSVHLDPRGLLQVESQVRRELADDFNTVFGASGLHLEALPSSGFLMLTPQLGDATTVDPARVLGGSISEALPTASSAPTLRRLSAEIEMWLHDHRVNAERAKQGRLPISALWLWGGGPAREGLGAEPEPSAQVADTVPASAIRGATLARASHAPGVAFGRDPYLHGLWCSGGSRPRAVPEHFEEVLAHSGRRAVFVLELSHSFDEHRTWTIREALADADQRWIASALGALRRKDVARVTVIANDHKLSLSARDPWKLWRMPRAALTALQ